jgi:hypothetical protein
LKACGEGGSIGDIAGRHMTANAAITPPIMNAAATIARVRGVVIRPSFIALGHC